MQLPDIFPSDIVSGGLRVVVYGFLSKLYIYLKSRYHQRSMENSNQRKQTKKKRIRQRSDPEYCGISCIPARATIFPILIRNWVRW